MPVVDVDSRILQVFRGGREVAIQAIQPAERLPRVIVLIDTSGSMRASEPVAATLAERLLAKLPPETKIGLAFFASKFVPMAPLGTDRLKIAFELESLKNRQYYSEGLTALWAAVSETVKMFGTPEVGDTIYLISDGRDNRGRDQMRGAVESLAASGIRLFATVLLGDPSVRGRGNLLELSGPGMLKDAVRSTGGSLLSDPVSPGGFYLDLDLVAKNGKPTPFSSYLDRQVRQILQYYRLDISLPEPIQKPQTWKLQIARDSRTSNAGIQLIYPVMLMPCR